MSWTSGVGRACGVLLDAIVRLLALSRINPNILTLMGLVVNTYAAFLFGYANGDNQRRMFFYAGLVIIGSGFFDLVDGRVARASNQVTRFGGFLIPSSTGTAMRRCSSGCWFSTLVATDSSMSC